MGLRDYFVAQEIEFGKLLIDRIGSHLGFYSAGHCLAANLVKLLAQASLTKF
jgi:hypothetical protein